VGLTQVFDSFSQGYRPEQQREPLFIALCAANGFDGPALRTQAEQARSGVGHHSLEEVKGWLSNRGEGAPAPIAGLLQGVVRPDFHYSRLVAVGLLSLLQSAQGADALEPQALRSAAHEIGEAMGLIKDRVDKDLSLYAGNIEKMSQAVELMEETVAAERRRRERAEQERLGASADEVAGSTDPA
jgi:photosystem II biogenesis protein Psp29